MASRFVCLPVRFDAWWAKKVAFIEFKLPPLFHHGMMILGLNKCHSCIVTYKTGGTLYGVRAMSWASDMISTLPR